MSQKSGKHDAILIEDAEESLSTTYKGCQTGTFGDYFKVKKAYNG